jgi:hypothetical protein
MRHGENPLRVVERVKKIKQLAADGRVSKSKSSLHDARIS